MSKNAATKRRMKARHRDQFSRLPSTTSFAWLIRGVLPVSTPMLDVLRGLATGEPITKATMDAAMLTTRAG